jgi:hypothetical protein
MPIIEILTPKLSDCPAFVVNTAVASVPVADVSVKTLQNAALRSKWKQGDNFQVVSMGFWLPFYFVMGETSGSNYTSPSLGLGITSSSGYRSLSTIGGTGEFFLPMENCEFTVDVLANVDGIDSDFTLDYTWFTSGIVFPQVSMIGAPAILNSKTLHVVPFVKVLHNFPLQT